jgi:DNA repair exonuclease SbcCD ATPase subunit
VKSSAKDAEVAKLREENTQAKQLQSDLQDAKNQIAAQTEQIASFQPDKEELLGLRNKVGKLQQDNLELSKQVQTAQAQVASATQSGTEKLQALQTQNQQLRSAVVHREQIEQRNVCINNLRQLDGAKQQWALENGKTATAIPTGRDITPYLPGNKLPMCPAGGTYTLNAVGQLPTCSYPQHALPQ